MYINKVFKNIPKQYNKHKFNNISLDSRKCKNGDIFFSINGENQNGNNFIKEAITNGARTIVSDLKFQGKRKNIIYIREKNVRKLVPKIASRFYKKKIKNLTAITGTNGKSSIANFYFQILNLNKLKVASIGTLGIKTSHKSKQTDNTTLDPIQIHETLYLLNKKKINNVILEASSHGLKQNRLDALNFDTSIFTNLSRDHLDYHNTYKDYFNSKLILFKKLTKKKGTIIYDNDIPQSKIFKKICKKNKIKSLTIGNKNSDLIIKKHEYIGNSQKIYIKFNKINYSFKTNLIGKIQIKNLLFSALASSKNKIKFQKIINSLNKIKPVAGRLENIGHVNNNSKVILDYAHTPDALKSALESIIEQFNHSSISIVFGCGGDRDKKKRITMGKIANDYCKRIFLTDDNPRFENPKKIRNQIKKKIEKNKLIEIPSRKMAITKAVENLKSGDILLVAGKGHENYQEIKNYKKIFSDKSFILKSIKLKNKKLSKDWKVNILNEKINFQISKNCKFKKASIDSRNIKNNDIFFAIKGTNNDGNSFADEALSKGASIAIVNKKNKFHRSRKILVKDTLKLLTEASQDIRKVSKAKFISITGSSGKTSLKDLLCFGLDKFAKISKSDKSYNNKYGVPLSLFNINKDDKYVVLEVGMDKSGEIDDLTQVIKPNIGVITNISFAHIKNFKNLRGIANAKSEIMNNITKYGKIVLNQDDFFFNYLKKIAIRKKLKVISFSKKNTLSNIHLKKIKSKTKDSEIIVSINKYNKTFIIKNNLKPYLSNILASIAIISQLCSIKNINKNLFYNFKPSSSRGDIKKIKVNKKKIILIDESYNSNPLSLEFAINNFDKQFKNNKYLILGDMLELGKFSKKLHKNMSKIINKSSISKVYVTGNYIKETYNGIERKKRGRILSNKNEIYKLIKYELNNNDHLMVKASNSTGLNNIIRRVKKGYNYAL